MALGGEVHAVALHHEAPAHQLAQLGPIDAVGWGGRHARRLEGRQKGWSASGSRTPPIRARPPVDLDAGHARRERPAPGRRAWPTSRPSGPGTPPPGRQSLDAWPRPARRRHPAARRVGGRRCAGERLQLVGQNPPALGHDPVGDVDGGEVGSHLGRRADRRDIEDLAAADGLVAAAAPAGRSGRPAAAGPAWARWRRTRPAVPGAMADPASTRTFTGCSPDPT